MSANYRDRAQFPSSSQEEESVFSSSSSGEEPQVIGVLSSPSSQYLVQSFLGEGSYGKVAKCIKSATNKTVAVKIMKGTNLTSASLREAQILERLRAFDSDRFNFVTYNGAFMDSEHVCLEFEMLDVSLFDFVQKKPSRSLSVKEIRPILHQMATTLRLLKSLGVAHTDLKPDNIMMVDRVNQPFKIKMIDFGLACHVSQSKWGSYMQPRYYRSPEIILGFPFTTAIDMWSLGCIAAELFLGHVLYPGSSEYNMLRHMVQTQGQLPHQLLNKGIKTRRFFYKKRGNRRRWRLKTPHECGEVTPSESYFKSLNDFTKIRPACHLTDEDTEAEIEDREYFVDLLKKMLHLDVGKRILPDQLLEDPFISMSDLAVSYTNSFYMKSCCKIMKVCRDQSPRSDDKDQQPWLNPQPSTSSAGTARHNFPGQVAPAQYRRQEHRITLGIPSAVPSGLGIQEAQSYKGKGRAVRKMDTSYRDASQSGYRSTESILPESKRMEMDSGESHGAPSSEAQIKRSKRTWATFVASHSKLRTQLIDSPERKKMKMSLLKDVKEAPIEDASSEVQIKPTRKRTWATFAASYSGLRTQIIDSPERKKMKMSLVKDLKEAPIEAPSSEVQIEPTRKRTWATFVASHSGLSVCSPERKKRKMILDELETQTKKCHNSDQASSSKAKSPESKTQNPDCSSPERKTRKRKISSDEAPDTVATTRCLRKRKH